MHVQLGELRRLILTAVVSDDALMEKLVLKGGNALELVHRIGGRASLDIDFSIEGDFQDLGAAERRLEGALLRRLASAGYSLFDFSFHEKPEGSDGQRWGGYVAEFKLIELTKAHKPIEARRREATITGTGQKRIFRIEMSKNEHCAGKSLVTVDDFELYVYSPAMIAMEKLRAICQQMPGYTLRKKPTPRPRDFYDIHAIVSQAGVQLKDHADLAQAIFAAKEVPVSLLAKLGDQRAFHQMDWPSVQEAVSGTLREFEFYFNFVLDEVKALQALWDI